MEIKFLNRADFLKLPHVTIESITDSGRPHSKWHVNGKQIENKLKDIEDYAYATAVRDCTAVAILPEDKSKKAKLLHLNPAKFLDNLKTIDDFIRLGLSDEDLKKSSTVMLGALGPLKEYGELYANSQKDSEKFLDQLRVFLKNIGTKISEFTMQIPTWQPMTASESHIFVDRAKDTVYICADRMQVPINTKGGIYLNKDGNVDAQKMIKEGPMDEALMVSSGGLTGQTALQKYFGNIKVNSQHKVSYDKDQPVNKDKPKSLLKRFIDYIKSFFS